MGRQPIFLKMRFLCRRVARVAVLPAALAAISACGGGSSEPPPPMYSIGGGVSGLNAGQSLVLLNNGGDSLTVSANGPFTFATRLSSGDFYSVTASAPLGTRCTITGGSGTALADVTGVAVACSTPPPFVGYSVGGTTSGLVGQGLVLNLYGLNYSRPQVLDQLVIGGNTNFQFTTTIGSSGPNQQVDIYPDLFHYAVVIHEQPQSPAQQCAISDRYSDFTITANVADVSIVCGEFSYSTNQAGNSISAFSVDASTGALVRVGPSVATGRAPYAMASTGDRGHLYVANGDSNDVSAFDIDPSSGALTQIPGSPLAAGTRPRAIALYRSTLFVANAGSNNLSVFRVDPTSGVPTPSSPANYATGIGPSVMAIEPGRATIGSYPVVYVANAGSNDISAFWVLGFLGPEQALESAGSPFPSGKSATSLAFGYLNGGGALFAANATGSDATISGFSIDPNSAALAPLPGFPFALPSCNFVAADRTGRYLYAVAGTQLFAYRIDEQTGALGALPGSPIALGTAADSISIDATNQFLYLKNGSAQTVMGFDRDNSTGALTPMPGSPFAVGQASDFFATF